MSNLSRFIDAQEAVYADALSELRAGHKKSHWMWFIFPQIFGLGRSEMARRFAIASRAEAVAYLADPILGARLRECARATLMINGRAAFEIFGSPDDLKFHSSMTLFAAAGDPADPFREALRKFFDGRPDDATLQRLRAG